jgi:hypothetical protein
MTPLRAGVSLLLIGVVCLTVVVLRVERMRLEARTQAHLTALIDHRREMWNAQMEIARLRSPEQVFDRAARMDMAVGAALDQMFTTDRPDVRYAAKNR